MLELQVDTHNDHKAGRRQNLADHVLKRSSQHFPPKTRFPPITEVLYLKLREEDAKLL